MTTQLAMEYIPRRMKELGYGDSYSLQFRHFVLQPKEKRKIATGIDLLVLVDCNDNISVKSDFGVFDITSTNINELQYEHQGNMQLKNYAGTVQHIRFIQVIPNFNK